MTGPEILRACAASADSPAWDEFCARWHAKLGAGAAAAYRIAGRSLADDDHRADAIQDVYAHLLANGRARLRACTATSDAEIEAYLFRTAEHVTLDSLRRAATVKRGADTKHVPLEEVVVHIDPALNPEQRAVRAEGLRLALDACRDTLDRAVLVLYAAGYTGDEIAARADTKPSTVYTRVMRLKQRLAAA